MKISRNSRQLFSIVLIAYSAVARAETCPATVEILERKISSLYEWTVEEGTTLDDLLSVNKLYSVRIHNDGGFVSCRYTARNYPVKLDAKPELDECRVEGTKGDWRDAGPGQQVCHQKNLYECEFKIRCKDQQD